jgi:hypothetical protein
MMFYVPGGLRLVFGKRDRKLSEQLRGKLPEKDLRALDKHANAIALLFFEGLLSESETRTVRERMFDRVAKLIEARNAT